MIKVTYIGHSGFWVEWPDCIWLFDYYEGKLPDVPPEKPLYIFVSISMQTTLILLFFRFKLMRVRLIFYLTMSFATGRSLRKNFQRICIQCVPARNCLS